MEDTKQLDQLKESKKDLATHKPVRYQTFAMDFSNYSYFRAYVKALTWEKCIYDKSMAKE